MHIRSIHWRRCAVAVATVLAALAAVPALAVASIPSLGRVEHVNANGLSVGYRQGGSGTPLIMVIGRAATMAEWDPQLIDQLLPDHHVVIFDNRGVGTTNNPSHKPVTIQLMAKDTLALATALHIRKFDLMGWSQGSQTSQQAALDAQNRVLKLILCATDSGGSSYHPPANRILQLLESPNLTTLDLLALSFPPTPAGIKGEFAYTSRVYAQYKRDDLPSDSFTVSKRAAIGQAHAANQWRAHGDYDELPKLETQTLVMWGNLDIVVPPANDKEVVAALPNATSEVFKGAGHGFLFQDSKQVGRAMDRFLR
jgi:pimeloyl-ACP methyl ester carboxylesterase